MKMDVVSSVKGSNCHDHSPRTHKANGLKSFLEGGGGNSN